MFGASRAPGGVWGLKVGLAAAAKRLPSQNNLLFPPPSEAVLQPARRRAGAARQALPKGGVQQARPRAAGVVAPLVGARGRPAERLQIELRGWFFEMEGGCAGWNRGVCGGGLVLNAKEVFGIGLMRWKRGLRF